MNEFAQMMRPLTMPGLPVAVVVGIWFFGLLLVVAATDRLTTLVKKHMIKKAK